jgi:spermidine synthase
VGLGVGTMAAYGEKGDLVKFYEINPQVEQIARRHFFYLADTPAKAEVVIGDARLSMEREPPQDYDLIVLDAFSGDAIPVHLLTLEAIGIYKRHLKPTGVIAIHVSNRHLDLVPVVGTLAKETGMYVVKVPNGQETGAMECTSDWMLVTASAEFASHPRLLSCSHTLDDKDTQGPLWTDQFSNLLQIVK